MAREISVGSKWRFKTPSYLGGRPIVTVKDFKTEGHQVTYEYPDAPGMPQTRLAESFLNIYDERVS